VSDWIIKVFSEEEKEKVGNERSANYHDRNFPIMFEGPLFDGVGDWAFVVSAKRDLHR
jgi:hypothetical protein